MSQQDSRPPGDAEDGTEEADYAEAGSRGAEPDGATGAADAPEAEGGGRKRSYMVYADEPEIGE
jgi:hypothetical protein